MRPEPVRIRHAIPCPARSRGPRTAPGRLRQYGPQLAPDLAGVTFIDCADVNVLLATRRRAGLEDGSVDVIGASPRVRRVISLLGLEWAFGLR
jgi:anti-anti-sigma factor